MYSMILRLPDLKLVGVVSSAEDMVHHVNPKLRKEEWNGDLFPITKEQHDRLIKKYNFVNKANIKK